MGRLARATTFWPRWPAFDISALSAVRCRALHDSESGACNELKYAFDLIAAIMAEPSSPATPAEATAAAPQLKVEEETQHAPSIPSPLNPDAAAAKAKKAPPAREQREKKDSLKKREAQGAEIGRSEAPDNKMPTGKSSKKSAIVASAYPELQRYVIEKPKPNDLKPPAPPVMTADMIVQGIQMYQITEQ